MMSMSAGEMHNTKWTLWSWTDTYTNVLLRSVTANSDNNKILKNAVKKDAVIDSDDYGWYNRIQLCDTLTWMTNNHSCTLRNIIQ